MQYERHGFVNRNVLADGTKMTIPVAEHDTFAQINRVRIGDPTGRGREKVARTLEHKFGAAGDTFAEELRRPYRQLVGLNAQLLRLLFDEIGITSSSTTSRISAQAGTKPRATVWRTWWPSSAAPSGCPAHRAATTRRGTVRGARHRGQVFRLVRRVEPFRDRTDPPKHGESGMTLYRVGPKLAVSRPPARHLL